MKILKVGAVGAGRATQELTIPAFRHVSNGELVAVCEINKELGQQIAEANNLKYFSELDEMINNTGVDVVIINTPVKTHADLAIKAMRLGCHVIIEKPAVADLHELDDIRKISEETNKKVTVVHNYKFYEGPQMAFKMYQDGVLGEIVHIDRVWMNAPQNDRMESDRDGWWHKITGGRLADALPHLLYLPYMFVGPMELVAVSARKLAKDRPWSFCDEADVILKTNKAFVNIRESLNLETTPYKGYIYHTIIYGTKLSVFCDYHNAEIIWRSSGSRMLKRGVMAGRDIIKQRIKKILPLTKRPVITRGAHNVFYEKFFDYINGHGENPASWEEIKNVAKLTDQIAKRIDSCITNGDIL